MSSTGEEILDWIDANSATWTKGTNAFLDRIPDHRNIPNRALAVRVTAGPVPGYVLGQDDPVMETPGLQLITRSKYFEESRDDAEALYRLLPTIKQTTLGSTTWYSVLAQATPAVVARDAQQRVHHTVNFRVTKALSA